MCSHKTKEKPVILWFRQDLRLTDHPALIAAVETGRPVLPVYIQDDDTAGDFKTGAAGRWWLHHSLKALQAELGAPLYCAKGNAVDILQKMITDTGAKRFISIVLMSRGKRIRIKSS